MKYFWSLSPVSDVGLYAVLNTETSVLVVAQANNDRVLQSWDDITSPNGTQLYDWAMSNGALPLVQAVDLAEAKAHSGAAVADPAVEITDTVLTDMSVDAAKAAEEGTVVNPTVAEVLGAPVTETPTETPTETGGDAGGGSGDKGGAGAGDNGGAGGSAGGEGGGSGGGDQGGAGGDGSADNSSR